MDYIIHYVNEFIFYMIDHITYYWVVILMAIESSFIPFPSEFVIPPAAYKSFEGNMSIYVVWMCATLGSLLGALFNYYLAMYVGRPWLYKFADSRIGKLMLLNRKKIDDAEAYFDKRGSISTLVGRFIPWIRQIISLPAGLAEMNIFKFILYTVIGSGIWNAVLCILGYTLAREVPKDQLVERVAHYSKEIGLTIFFIVIIYLLVKYLIRRYKKKHQTKD